MTKTVFSSVAFDFAMFYLVRYLVLLSVFPIKQCKFESGMFFTRCAALDFSHFFSRKVLEKMRKIGSGAPLKYPVENWCQETQTFAKRAPILCSISRMPLGFVRFTAKRVECLIFHHQVKLSSDVFHSQSLLFCCFCSCVGLEVFLQNNM